MTFKRVQILSISKVNSVANRFGNSKDEGKVGSKDKGQDKGKSKSKGKGVFGGKGKVVAHGPESDREECKAMYFGQQGHIACAIGYGMAIADMPTQVTGCFVSLVGLKTKLSDAILTWEPGSLN